MIVEHGGDYLRVDVGRDAPNHYKTNFAFKSASPIFLSCILDISQVLSVHIAYCDQYLPHSIIFFYLGLKLFYTEILNW